MSLKAYWLSSYLWDFLSLVPPVAFTLIVLAAAGVDALISGEAGVATFLLFLLYGLSMVCVKAYILRRSHVSVVGTAGASWWCTYSNRL